MIQKVQFAIGLNDKDTLKPVCGEQEGLVFVRDLAAQYFGGCTAIPGKGAYIMQDSKTQVCENSILCFVYGDITDESVIGFCNKVKSSLNQQSVAVEKTIVDSKFY